MRYVLYDGILESHLSSSLERALRRRGHAVYNTGKIGSGFKFVRSGSLRAKLDVAIARTMAFEPDVVFVFRPASLPREDLIRLKSSGAQLVAWFSDDPVLFRLSYAPVLDLYDLVLHCGTAEVLAFYEERFGRPTGVNFPFWTDHVAFPYVWGRDERETDVLFLGNVHDSVRRRRYFDLSRMTNSLRVHGATRSDIYDLSGGYLDTDFEVAAAGASSAIALNIPQFFEDHEGLETWFPGLGDLGYFEFPSRVVQYMAMGLPTVSVVPGVVQVPSAPEIICVDDISSADEIVTELLQDESRLQSLSLAMERRFSSNFSADSRVLALESLLETDDWRNLDALERSTWFTSFDGSMPTEANTALQEPDQISLGEATPKALDRVLFVTSSAGSSEWMSVSASTVRALEGICAVTDVVSAREVKGTLAFDDTLTQGGFSPDFVLLENLDLPLDRMLRRDLQRRGVPVFAWLNGDDQVGVSLVSKIKSVDVVGVRQPELADTLWQLGYENVVFAPFGIDEQAIEVLGGGSASGVSHWVFSREREETLCPAYLTDIDSEFQIDYDIRRLSGMPKLEMMERSSEISLVDFFGTRARPQLPAELAFVVASSVFTVIPRATQPASVAPYSSALLQVRNPGELSRKMHRLSRSRYLRESLLEHRDDLLGNALSIENQLKGFRERYCQMCTRDEKGLMHLDSDSGTAMPGCGKLLAENTSGELQLRMDIVSLGTALSNLEIRVNMDGKTVARTAVERTREHLIIRGLEGCNQVYLCYVGPPLMMAATALAGFKVEWSATGKRSRDNSVEIWKVLSDVE